MHLEGQGGLSPRELCLCVIVTTVRGGSTFGAAYLLKTPRGDRQRDRHAHVTDVVAQCSRESPSKNEGVDLWGRVGSPDICYVPGPADSLAPLKRAWSGGRARGLGTGDRRC